MNPKKSNRRQASDEEIDKIVESQVEEDSAWERPIKVRRTKSTALSLPADLAARAARRRGLKAVAAGQVAQIDIRLAKAAASNKRPDRAK